MLWFIFLGVYVLLIVISIVGDCLCNRYCLCNINTKIFCNLFIWGLSGILTCLTGAIVYSANFELEFSENPSLYTREFIQGDVELRQEEVEYYCFMKQKSDFLVMDKIKVHDTRIKYTSSDEVSYIDTYIYYQKENNERYWLDIFYCFNYSEQSSITYKLAYYELHIPRGSIK